jgi:hypothetical protein
MLRRIEIGMKCNPFFDSFSRGCDPENGISTTCKRGQKLFFREISAKSEFN